MADLKADRMGLSAGVREFEGPYQPAALRGAKSTLGVSLSGHFSGGIWGNKCFNLGNEKPFFLLLLLLSSITLSHNPPA